MASITIRNLDDSVKRRLRKQAAENGRSLEAEAREILDRASRDLQKPRAMNGLELFRPLRDVVEKYGGFELEIPPRTPIRDPDWGSGGRHRAQLQEESRTFRAPKKPARKRK
jgi:plasmid stability protein